MTQNAWLMQRQADVLGIPVRVSPTAEATALGVAAFAGLGEGSDRAGRSGGAGLEGTTLEPLPHRSNGAKREYAAWLEFVGSHR